MAKWPEHNDPTEDHAAKAPYNFVPLPERVVTVDPTGLPDQDRYYPDRHSGWIDCQLTAASPLYVRAALEPGEFERSLDQETEEKRPWAEQVRNKPDFFYTTDRARPVIPGSSLRGMLRALVEIAGYGKVEGVTSRPLVYRAVGDTTSHGERYRERLMRLDGEEREDGKRYYKYTPLMRAGYMEKDRSGDWAIRPAQEINGVTFARISDKAIPGSLKPWKGCKNASAIWVQPGAYEYQTVRGGFIRTRYARVVRAAAALQPGLVEAVLTRSGWIPNKRSEAVIFAPDAQAQRIKIEDDLVKAYRDQLTQIYQQQALRGTEKDALLGPEGALKEGQPVFYLVEDGRLVFFSHCMMLRLPYRRSPRDFVPASLREPSDVDLAEAIFGYTKERGEGKERAYAGRVFVSDAVLEGGQPDEAWLNGDRPVVPKILGGPKPTTFQHYLAQQHPNPIPTGGRFSDGRPRTRMELSDYASSSPGETVLRGHKLYWHKGKGSLQDIQEKDPDKSRDTQHTQIRPVKAGVTFRFRIRFENLSDVELGALLWVLDKADDEAYRLKLGMGKPYGMGAVKVTAAVRVEDRRRRYSALFDEGDWNAGLLERDDIWPRATQAFERFVLDQLKVTSPRRLEEIERIQMLLAMLAWPGPDPQQTRYLEIEHVDPRAKRGKVNEYKDRPVLPGPLAALGRPTAQPQRASQPAPQQVQPAPRPARAAQTGLPADYKRGTVKSYGLGANRSFGFIISDDTGEEVFVHQSKLAPGVTTLEAGQKVTFRQVRGKKGPEAEDVRLA